MALVFLVQQRNFSDTRRRVTLYSTSSYNADGVCILNQHIYIVKLIAWKKVWKHSIANLFGYVLKVKHHWSHLRNNRSDWRKTYRKCISWILGQLCDLELPPHPWPWPWIVQVFNFIFETYISQELLICLMRDEKETYILDTRTSMWHCPMNIPMTSALNFEAKPRIQRRSADIVPKIYTGLHLWTQSTIFMIN